MLPLKGLLPLASVLVALALAGCGSSHRGWSTSQVASVDDSSGDGGAAPVDDSSGDGSAPYVPDTATYGVDYTDSSPDVSVDWSAPAPDSGDTTDSSGDSGQSVAAGATVGARSSGPTSRPHFVAQTAATRVVTPTIVHRGPPAAPTPTSPTATAAPAIQAASPSSMGNLTVQVTNSSARTVDVTGETTDESIDFGPVGPGETVSATLDEMPRSIVLSAKP